MALTTTELKRQILARDVDIRRLCEALAMALPCLDAFAGQGIEVERDDDGLTHDPALILGAMAAKLGFGGASAAEAMFHAFCPEYAPDQQTAADQQPVGG